FYTFGIFQIQEFTSILTRRCLPSSPLSMPLDSCPATDGHPPMRRQRSRNPGASLPPFRSGQQCWDYRSDSNPSGVQNTGIVPWRSCHSALLPFARFVYLLGIESGPPGTCGGFTASLGGVCSFPRLSYHLSSYRAAIHYCQGEAMSPAS